MIRHLRFAYGRFPALPCRLACALVVGIPVGLRAADPLVDFNRDIRPVLAENCYRCHGPDAEARQAELRLDLPLVRAPEARQNLLQELSERIASNDPDRVMPPPASNQTLTPAEREQLRRWATTGAVYAPHWSLIPPARPPLPTATVGPRARNAVDRFVLARMAARGLRPASEASRQTLIRRVTLDLTGLAPTPDELAQHLQDASPDAHHRLVDRLLSSPRFGEHIAWMWLEAARYGDTNGYQGDRTRTMHFWRDWVIRAFNDSMPFDQFTMEQLAGDLFPNPTKDQLVATGFNRNHPLNGEGGRIAEENRVEYVFDRTETTATVWLGFTVGCARCHDHKYDPISQREYYRLFAYFNNIAESGSVDKGGNANPVERVPDNLQRIRLASLTAEIVHARSITQGPLADLAALRTRWAAEIQSAHKSGSLQGWHALSPQNPVSTGDVKLRVLADGSVLASGPFPERADYALQASMPLKRLTGLRLEALTDERLEYDGPGRRANFVLTQFAVELHRDGAPPRSLQFSTATADHSEPAWPVAGAIDAADDKGWGISDGEINTAQDRQAVFTLKTPVELANGSSLVIKLRHQSDFKHHLLGRFRISATDVDHPSLQTPVVPPAQILQLLETPEGELTESQRDAVAVYHRSTTRVFRDARRAASLARAERRRITDKMSETMVMRDRPQPRVTHVLQIGRYDKPDTSQALSPGTPACLPAQVKDAPPNRLGLATWLVNGKHPLTARVAVNRYWQFLFGRGLVRTPEDFGTQGRLPTHPRLLDWLAREWVEAGWDLKQMARLLTTSATYRQSAIAPAETRELDPENQWLSHAPRHRLPSHVIRDNALFVAGLLVDKIGGPSVKPYQPAGLWADFSFGKIKYAPDTGAKLYRRSLYTFWRRSLGPPNLFDEANRQVCSVRTLRTNTPLHALTVLNDTTYVEAARVLAARVLAAASERRERIELAFLLALSRPPQNKERQILNTALDRLTRQLRADPGSANQFLSVGATPVPTGFDPIEVAAYGNLMTLLLNSDEFLSRE